VAVQAEATQITLDAPDPIRAVGTEKASGLVPLNRDQTNALNARAAAFVAEISVLDANSPEFGRMVDQLTNIGRKEIADAAGQSNRLLDRPARAMTQDSGVGSDLAQLRRTIEDLDPGKRGDLLTPKKLFGLIPFGDKMQDYFDGYKSSQSHIAAILTRLASGKDALLKDNADIDVERQNLWTAMGRLEQMIHLSKTLDRQLETKAAAVEFSDPGKSKAIKEQALYYIRQRTQDLLTQMAVSVQGYLALDLVKKNNVELVKGVDRASTTTVAALKTAVTVASALTHQRLVLDQISALNKTTANIIDSTGEHMVNNSARIHDHASSATVPLATLQRAFENIYITMDSIDSFKAKALTSMKTTVESLSNEVEKSRRYIADTEGQGQAAVMRQEATAFSPIDG
jgi:uncharacterized protein YaaN involved in tellurite resistance